MMMVSRLLKSCAMLPASRPMLSSFCDCRSCCSSRFRSVMFRITPTKRTGCDFGIEKHPPPAGKPTFLAIFNAEHSILLGVISAILVTQGILQRLLHVVAVGGVESLHEGVVGNLPL